MRLRKMMAVLLAGVLLAGEISGGGFLEPVLSDVFAQEDFAASGIQVDYHTQEEIRQYIKEQGITTSSLTWNGSPLTIYETEPSVTEPYVAGKMSSESTEYALKVFNSVRYIAGLSQVQLKEEYGEAAQAGALVNAANTQLSHQPTRPAGMSDELYQLASTGTGKSNLSMGSWNGPYGYHIVQSWMADSDNSNIDRVGHRRWILNPSMQYTGFGQAEASNGSNYYAMYAFDNAFGQTSQYGVIWPAQNMPVEYFGNKTAWSISMGSQIDKASVTVKLTDLTSGDSWSFSNASSDGDFYVNNDNYGKEGCIIFRPSSQMAYQDGDTYQVEITGLEKAVTYRVNFFSLEEKESPAPEVSEEPLASQEPDIISSQPPTSSTPGLSESPTPIPSVSPTLGLSGSPVPSTAVTPTPGLVGSPTQIPLATSTPGLEESPGSSPSVSSTPGLVGSPEPSPPVAPTPGLVGSPVPSSPVSPTPGLVGSPVPSPAGSPTVRPTVRPQISPSAVPTVRPTVRPSSSPSARPTVSPDDSEASAPARAKIRSLQNKKGRRLVVRIKPQKNCSGYQVQCSRYRNMKHSMKITVRGTAVTLNKLKKRKVYYVRVRAYRVIDGTRKYGAWSAVRRKKIKK